MRTESEIKERSWRSVKTEVAVELERTGTRVVARTEALVTARAGVAVAVEAG